LDTNKLKDKVVDKGDCVFGVTNHLLSPMLVNIFS